MTDWVRDSPIVTRPFCPVCEADIEQDTSMCEIRFCHMHQPSSSGADDDVIPASMRETYPAGSSEAGGLDNRAWCELLHRKRFLRTPS